MTIRIRRENVRAEDIDIGDHPLYMPLLVLLANRAKPGEFRTVRAGDLRIDDAFRAPAQHVDLYVRNFKRFQMDEQEHTPEHGGYIPVMRRHDGSLWVYDDCMTVEAKQRVDPDLPIKCAIFLDPTQ